MRYITEESMNSIVKKIYELTKNGPYRGAINGKLLNTSNAQVQEAKNILRKRNILFITGSRVCPIYEWNKVFTEYNKALANSIGKEYSQQIKAFSDKKAENDNLILEKYKDTPASEHKRYLELLGYKVDATIKREKINITYVIERL